MMIIEMRKAALDKALDLLDEIKELGHLKKLVLCELEDTLYKCFDSSEDEEDYEDTDYRSGDEYAERRRSMRNMRREMRDGMHMEEGDMNNTPTRTHSARMYRRNRMGRFV